MAHGAWAGALAAGYSGAQACCVASVHRLPGLPCLLAHLLACLLTFLACCAWPLSFHPLLLFFLPLLLRLLAVFSCFLESRHATARLAACLARNPRLPPCTGSHGSVPLPAIRQAFGSLSLRHRHYTVLQPAQGRPAGRPSLPVLQPLTLLTCSSGLSLRPRLRHRPARTGYSCRCGVA